MFVQRAMTSRSQIASADPGPTAGEPLRVGLVLGAGGVLGGAWLTGALEAIARQTRWDPGSADAIVGTSAGSMIGCLVAAGIPPWFMVAHSAGETFEGLFGPDGRPAGDADRAAGAVFRLHRGIPGLGPGSLRMAFTTIANPLRHTPLQLLAGWLPAGVVSTQSLSDTVRRAVHGRWPEHPSFWAVTCDYASGRRVPFGRIDSPPAHVADAVAASCAIPGFYRPVKIGHRRYVDGGVCSPSSLDLLAGRGLDLVLALSPLSSRDRVGGVNPVDRMSDLSRAANQRRLVHEASKVRRYGTDVVTIEPTAEDLRAMGRNWMSAARRQEVIETAIHTVGKQLRAPGVARQLSKLPPGEPHKIERPTGDPSTWPQIVPAQIAPGRRAA
jgi:NTE family protein